MGELEYSRHAPLAAETLCGAFQIAATERPQQVAHRAFGGGPEYTFAEFAARVRAVAEGLHALGVRRGDTVAQMLTNRPEFNLVELACARRLDHHGARRHSADVGIELDSNTRSMASGSTFRSLVN